MKITDVILFKVSGHWEGPGFPAGDRVAHPLDIYPAFNQREWQHVESHHPIQAQYVEIQTDEGISGLFGPIETEGAFIIAHFLRPFLIGRRKWAMKCCWIRCCACTVTAVPGCL